MAVSLCCGRGTCVREYSHTLCERKMHGAVCLTFEWKADRGRQRMCYSVFSVAMLCVFSVVMLLSSLTGLFSLRRVCMRFAAWPGYG